MFEISWLLHSRVRREEEDRTESFRRGEVRDITPNAWTRFATAWGFSQSIPDWKGVASESEEAQVVSIYSSGWSEATATNLTSLSILSSKRFISFKTSPSPSFLTLRSVRLCKRPREEKEVAQFMSLKFL